MVKVRGRAWAAKRGLLKPESRTPGQIDGAFFWSILEVSSVNDLCMFESLICQHAVNHLI